MPKFQVKIISNLRHLLKIIMDLWLANKGINMLQILIINLEALLYL